MERNNFRETISPKKDQLSSNYSDSEDMQTDEFI
jgi:hypothetical protein